MPHRLFAALLPPRTVLDELAGFLEPRWDADTPWRWTRPESWHITLAFLASVPDSRIDPLVESLAEVRGRRLPLLVGGGVAFPDALRARVLGLGVGPDDEPVARLAGAVRRACNRAGVEADGARFHAHLTVARASKPQPAPRWMDLFDTFESTAWTAGEFALIESHLGEGPRGTPRYEVVETFLLQGDRL